VLFIYFILIWLQIYIYIYTYSQRHVTQVHSCQIGYLLYWQSFADPRIICLNPMFYCTGSMRPFFLNEVGAWFSTSDRSQKKVGMEFDNLFCNGLCVRTKICHWFSHKYGQSLTISFAMVFVFVLFNYDWFCLWNECITRIFESLYIYIYWFYFKSCQTKKNVIHCKTRAIFKRDRISH
jgi:hypothetical protein